MNRLFYDTNVLLDVLERRVPWFPESSACLSLARSGECRGATNALSISNISYIQRATPPSEICSVFRRLRDFLEIAPLNSDNVDAALKRALPDLEDGLQLESALAWGATHLITRNAKDFPSNASLLVLAPTDYLSRHRTG
ncbi:MAG: hypothetical protein GVY36_10940 [Verrucomicrobia bacterium]|jgi:predicted nucleic acid-binding protein|nr:hypothetical protein [Verrucomicrobiota bacterium]